MRLYAILYSTILSYSVLTVSCSKTNETQTNSDLEVATQDGINNASYWTQEKLSLVKPYPVPIYDQSDSTRSGKTAADQITFRTIRSAKGLRVKPMPMPTLTAEQMLKLGIKPTLIQKKLAGKVLRQNVSDPMFRPMGRLVFVDNEDTHYHCSGQYISDYIVLTAGHCVYNLETGGWNKNFVFFQQYLGDPVKAALKKGVQRAVLKALVAKNWFASGKEDFGHDFALLAMKEPTVGGYYNIDIPEKFDNWTNAGYPVNYGKGEVFHTFKGKKGSVTSDIIETPGNPMGPGSSGGGWITSIGPVKYVVGVNSFSFAGRQGMFSPHFKSQRIKALMDKAQQVLFENRNLTRRH